MTAARFTLGRLVSFALALAAIALVGYALGQHFHTLSAEHLTPMLFAVGSIKDFRAGLGSLTPVPGQKVRADLRNGTRSYWLAFRARAQVDIAVAPVTSIRNRGSVFALYDKLGVEEDGTERHALDGPLAKFLTEFHFGSPSTTSRLTSTAIGTYQLDETLFLWFSHPLSASPEEVVYREVNAARKLQAFVQEMAGTTGAGGTIGNALVVPGGATVTISNVSVTVTQYHDMRSVNLPVFKPTAREIVEEITGANTKRKIELKFSNFVRLIAMKQEVQTTASPARVEVSDIINRVTMKGDVLTFLDDIPMADLQYQMEQEASGLVVSNQAYWAHNFQKGGKLGNVLNPGDDVAMRYELDVQPSATAGTSRVRLAFLELEREVPGVIVSPAIPFPI